MNKSNITLTPTKRTMEHVKVIECINGVDAGYHGSNIDPINREGCVGKSGIDKTFSFEQVLELASKLEEKPNIIVKGGPNAKWYLKRFPRDDIAIEIDKQKSWRDVSSCRMYIITWE